MINQTLAGTGSELDLDRIQAGYCHEEVVVVVVVGGVSKPRCYILFESWVCIASNMGPFLCEEVLAAKEIEPFFYYH